MLAACARLRRFGKFTLTLDRYSRRVPDPHPPDVGERRRALGAVVGRRSPAAWAGDGRRGLAAAAAAAARTPTERRAVRVVMAWFPFVGYARGATPKAGRHSARRRHRPQGCHRLVPWPHVRSVVRRPRGAGDHRAGRRAGRRVQRGRRAESGPRAPDRPASEPSTDSPSPSSSPTTTPEPATGHDACCVVGDIMLGRGVAPAARGAGDARSGSLADRLAAGRPHGRQPREHAVRRREPPQPGRRLVRAPLPDRVAGSAALGFDALSLANNHTGDFGVRSRCSRPSTGCAAAGSAVLRRGPRPGRGPVAAADPRAQRRPLRLRGLQRDRRDPAGRAGRARCAVGADAAAHRAARAGRPRPRDRCGALAGATGSTSWSCCRTGARSTPTRPEPVQRWSAGALSRAGADLVVGGHPHWVQGLERVGDGA